MNKPITRLKDKMCAGDKDFRYYRDTDIQSSVDEVFKDLKLENYKLSQEILFLLVKIDKSLCVSIMKRLDKMQVNRYKTKELLDVADKSAKVNPSGEPVKDK